MPSKFRLRPIFAPIVKALAKGLKKIGITANIASLLMLAFSLLSGVFLVLGDSFLWFGIFIFLTGIMDGVDGAIARLSEKHSNFGGILDSTLDRLSEAIILGALLIDPEKIFAFSFEFSLILVMSSFVCSFMISYTRARAELAHSTIDANVGLMARSERLFYLFLLSLISHFWIQSAFSYGFLLYFILVCSTMVYRILHYKKELVSENPGRKN